MRKKNKNYEKLIRISSNENVVYNQKQKKKKNKNNNKSAKKKRKRKVIMLRPTVQRSTKITAIIMIKRHNLINEHDYDVVDLADGITV